MMVWSRTSTQSSVPASTMRVYELEDLIKGSVPKPPSTAAAR